MTLLDERGRIFGRINVIDALVGALVAVLLPLAFGAFALFRVPRPVITSIEPAEVIEHQMGALRITGQDLRPFLQARIGAATAPAFLVESPTTAEIRLPDLVEGTYDLALFDNAEELARVPGAVRVVRATVRLRSETFQTMELHALGWFVIGKTGVNATAFKVGATLGSAERLAESRRMPVAEILAVRRALAGIQQLQVSPTELLTVRNSAELRLPAILRLTCDFQETACWIESSRVQRGGLIRLVLSSASVPVRFEIHDVQLPGNPLDFSKLPSYLADDYVIP